MPRLSLSRSAIILWLIRHASELPGVVPLIKDVADYGGIVETIDDVIAILQWAKPIMADFPTEEASVAALSVEQESEALRLFNGDGTRLKRLIDALLGVAEIIDMVRGLIPAK